MVKASVERKNKGNCSRLAAVNITQRGVHFAGNPAYSIEVIVAIDPFFGCGTIIS